MQNAHAKPAVAPEVDAFGGYRDQDLPARVGETLQLPVSCAAIQCC